MSTSWKMTDIIERARDDLIAEAAGNVDKRKIDRVASSLLQSITQGSSELIHEMHIAMRGISEYEYFAGIIKREVYGEEEQPRLRVSTRVSQLIRRAVNKWLSK